jgi:hypothetical protein
MLQLIAIQTKAGMVIRLVRRVGPGYHLVGISPGRLATLVPDNGNQSGDTKQGECMDFLFLWETGILIASNGIASRGLSRELS